MGNSETAEHIESLKASAADAPVEPGVYIMRDGEGRIVYVGKAKSLRNRLKSYFAGTKDIKTATLIRHARSIETIIVASEYEALLLENTLIKQHSPRYNINLKDGKTYPVIRITSEDFPRIFRTRTIVHDNSLYYGPFPNVQGVDAMLELIDKLFPLRKCRKMKKEPCMYYHIGRCLAPCCGKIGKEEYQSHVERVRQLLAGETESLVIGLTAQMHEAARALQFERAAQVRNAIRAIEQLAGEESSVVDHDAEGRDYIAWAAEGVLATFTVFSMRGGKMTGRELFRTRSAADEGESLEMFITSYYEPNRPPPEKIYIQTMLGAINEEGGAPPLAPASADAPSSASPPSGGEPPATPPKNLSPGADAPPSSLPDWFRERFGFEPELLPAAAGGRHHAAILAMARQNALEDLRRRIRERGAGPALDELRQALNLRGRPELIEGFDIAQLDGAHPVASLISFRNGVPDRKNYRYFKLRSVVGKVDDFAAMREAVHRRYSRLIREEKELPGLVLIDGGIGQVNAAKGVMDELGMDSDVVGLAKREEELWLPHAKAPVVLSRSSEALKILQFVRDETHRFATGFNQRLRSKDLRFPALETVDGIGPKRAAAIMKAYETIENIAAADTVELAECCRLSEASAKAVRAAAKLALEDRETGKQRLAAKGSRQSGSENTAALANEALSDKSLDGK
jgi:excinuclease ABC subunit C